MDRRPVSVVTLVLVGLGLCGGLEARASTLPIQVMPLGDSITYGFSDPVSVPGGYRSVLYRDLSSVGLNVQLVGSQATNFDPGLPVASRGHEGHSGFLIAGTGGYSTIALAGANINHWLAPGNGINPSLILLEIGTNEISGSYHEATAPADLAALVTRILDLRPRAEILVSTITPQAVPFMEAEVRAFNQALGGPNGVVARLRKRGEKVVLVNAGGSLTVNDLSADGLHPNREGYIKLGNAWAGAVESVLRPGLRIKPAPAPEPTTLAILGLGLIAGGVVARSRQRSGN